MNFVLKCRKSFQISGREQGRCYLKISCASTGNTQFIMFFRLTKFFLIREVDKEIVKVLLLSNRKTLEINNMDFCHLFSFFSINSSQKPH